MSIPDNQTLQIISCPEIIPYEKALEWQYRLAQLRFSGEISDTLIFLEHPPTITLGRKSQSTDLLTPRVQLNAKGISIYESDRGGEISYHAPGQLVGYPILDLKQHGQDLHQYLRDLEEVIIRVLNDFGINSERAIGQTGVWVNDEKIAAIGIKVSRWISMHGFALNINLDLAPMRQDFIPCGISDKGVTSLQEQRPDISWIRKNIEESILKTFLEVFNFTRFREQSGILFP